MNIRSQLQVNIEKLSRTTLADKQSIVGISVFDSTLLDQPKVSPSPPFIAFSQVFEYAVSIS